MKKLLVIGILLSMVFFAGSASAAWLGNCTINNISSEGTGNYSVNATSGASTFTFTIDTTAPNANAMLALLLTASSTGDTINVSYAAGGALQRVWLVK
jgi:hypothetical protein